MIPLSGNPRADLLCAVGGMSWLLGVWQEARGRGVDVVGCGVCCARRYVCQNLPN